MMSQNGLSRHCYALDEVSAALSYCCTRNDEAESIFWCRELLESGCAISAISCLFQTWLWDKGPYALGWLLDSGTLLADDEVNEEDIVHAADTLRSCYAMRDHSLWNLLYLDLHAKGCDRVTPKTPALSDGWLMSESDQFLARALYQGKAQSAWYVLRRYYTLEEGNAFLDRYVAETMNEREEVERCITLLRGYESLLGERSDAGDRILQCLIVCILCLPPKERAASLLRGRSRRDRKRLVSLRTSSKGRPYSPPTVCLYGQTRRGRIKWTESTLDELVCVERGLLGCPYWEELAKPYCISVDALVEGRLMWISEEAMETFYRRAFPEDIPDEWSLEEKKQSHGDGVLGPNESIRFSKFVRIHYSRVSRLAWNTGEDVQKRMIATELPYPQGVSMMDMYEKESQRYPPLRGSVIWKPLRRVLVF